MLKAAFATSEALARHYLLTLHLLFDLIEFGSVDSRVAQHSLGLLNRGVNTHPARIGREALLVPRLRELRNAAAHGDWN